MQQLNPTLWRTCRVLAGHSRLRLLRLLHDAPGQCVSELADLVGIGVSDASQELRRIQSRGLLRPEHCGARLVYRMKADPQVASATPLLHALKNAFDRNPPEQDAAMAPIAAGLAHPRRIAIAKVLMKSDLVSQDLRAATRIPRGPLSLHLDTLETGGWVRRQKRTLSFHVPGHPLAQALFHLIPSH
ncbi:MAG: ArsR family transcriptional regulator [Kiritimatiellia bacterium]